MKNRISDKEVLQLLTTLKNSDEGYPQDMIDSRRGAFARQAAAMAVLINAGVNGVNATGVGQTALTTSAASSGGTVPAIGGVSMGKILETALVIAIIAEAGVAAYVYREKIADFFNSVFNPRGEQAVTSPDNSVDFNTGNELLTDVPTETLTVTVTETPFPPEFTPPVQADDDNNGGSQIASTPTPPPTNDENGLHLGQTKQPTKEPDHNENNNK
jgi:hypothetical protein